MNKNRTADDGQLQQLRGEVAALKTLLLVLARATTDQPSFVEPGLRALEQLHTATLPTSNSDEVLQGIENIAKWLKAKTASEP